MHTVLFHPGLLSRSYTIGEALPRSTDGWPPTCQPVASAAPLSLIAKTFDATDAPALLRLNGYHFAHLPAFAPAFADLVRELRFSDRGDTARAAFIWEAVNTLRSCGQARAREYCLRATSQLQQEHSSRHVTHTVAAPIGDTRSIEDLVSDAEAAHWRQSHMWGG